MEKKRVLIIDDSALIRNVLTKIINSSDDLEVVGTAADPIIARDKIKQLNPDVLTLDIEMPRMDGITFLRNLMRLRPMPVVMISTLTEKGAAVTLEALEIGAVDFIPKPVSADTKSLSDYADEVVNKLSTAANVSFGSKYPQPAVTKQKSIAIEKQSADVVLAASPVTKQFKKTEKIIALGSSTGGTEALKDVVRGLPSTTPAMVVSQHLPVAFSESFAKHVNEASEMSVCIAQNGQQILPGNIYIAPGDQHLLIILKGSQYFCQLNDGPIVNRHKPSVEVMFRSVAQNVGSNAIGVMLTGMGADGAQAMKEMRDAGSVNIVQDEDSSVVWGMPGEAFKLDAADYVVPLNRIAAQILALAV